LRAVSSNAECDSFKSGREAGIISRILKTGLPASAAEIDTPAAGLLADLKQRGLLDSNLVIWGG
jgi:hypothetical protein